MAPLLGYLQRPQRGVKSFPSFSYNPQLSCRAASRGATFCTPMSGRLLSHVRSPIGASVGAPQRAEDIAN